VRAAREFVAATLDAHAFEGDTDAALLLVSELATNAVRHAATPFDIIIDLQGGRLRVAVIDHDVDHPPRVGQPSAQDPSGRGLLIVEQLSARWGTDELGDGSKSVWFTLA